MSLKGTNIAAMGVAYRILTTAIKPCNLGLRNANVMGVISVSAGCRAADLAMPPIVGFPDSKIYW
jgi:hypothetical protein